MRHTVSAEFRNVIIIVTKTFLAYHDIMNEAWTPDIDGTVGTIHTRLVRALRRDIAAGTLHPEGKMPAHRELARRLGIGVGTVTRAYAEAERLGLLTGTVGRGTFVVATAAPSTSAAAQPAPDVVEGPIDLTLNLPATFAAEDHIAHALRRVQSRLDLAQVVQLPPHAGLDTHRQSLAEWLRKRVGFTTVDWHHLIVTTGAQQAMDLSMATVCRPGDVVLTEAATFGGIRAIADSRHLRCAGVAMDRYGMIPEALDAAVREHGARVVYLQPTLQNPTTRTMPRSRRQEIVTIARRHDLTLVEDDVNAPVAYALDDGQARPAPLVMEAPERTFYINSFSKALAPGLRVGMLLAPDRARFDRVTVEMRSACYASGTLGPMIVTQWIKDGVAEQILGAVAQEASTRLTLAQRMLGDAMEAPSFPTSLHAWLPMSELRAERVANSALRRGVLLTPPNSFQIDGTTVSGLRLCLNTAPRPSLERALRVVRSVLADEIVPERMSVV